MGVNLHPPVKDKHLTLYVSNELRAKIDDYAQNARPKVSRSQAVRYILEKFFEDNFEISENNSGIHGIKVARKRGRKPQKEAVLE